MHVIFLRIFYLTFKSLCSLSMNIYIYLWVVILVFLRNPIVTITTNSYHFCKFSLVKKPSIKINQTETIKTNEHGMTGEMAVKEIQPESSRILEGSFLPFSSFEHLSCL